MKLKSCAYADLDNHDKFNIALRISTRSKKVGDCIILPAYKGSRYPTITVGSRSKGNRRTVRVHRVIYAIEVGAVTDGLFVLHKCDNPECINPKHLFLGTHTDNMADMKAKGRDNYLSGDKSNLSVLNSETVKDLYDKYTGRRGEITKLAIEYGVSKSAIKHILSGRNWVKITGGKHEMYKVWK